MEEVLQRVLRNKKVEVSDVLSGGDGHVVAIYQSVIFPADAGGSDLVLAGMLPVERL